MRTDRRAGNGALLRHLIALAAFASAFASPAQAFAFCRTRTVPLPASFDPSTTPSGCFEGGLPIYHPSRCLPYRLLAKESAAIPNAALSASLSNAFRAWTMPNAVCAPGIDAVEVASGDDTVIVSYRPGEPARNVVGVVEGPWENGDGADVLARPTVTFKADTGEILDVDIEIRGDLAWSFPGRSNANGFDLDVVLTHEVGHALGLAHSADRAAVMKPSYEQGATTPTALSEDDARGICEIYPSRQTRTAATGDVPSTACQLTSGAAGTGCGEPTVVDGCAAAPGGARAPASAIVILGLGALAMAAGRRRSHVQRS